MDTKRSSPTTAARGSDDDEGASAKVVRPLLEEAKLTWKYVFADAARACAARRTQPAGDGTAAGGVALGSGQLAELTHWGAFGEESDEPREWTHGTLLGVEVRGARARPLPLPDRHTHTPRRRPQTREPPPRPARPPNLPPAVPHTASAAGARGDARFDDRLRWHPPQAEHTEEGQLAPTAPRAAPRARQPTRVFAACRPAALHRGRR
eukprot:3837757-Prymnesium_polylepis.1